MPYKRSFTQVDPVLELTKHNTSPSITLGKVSKRVKGGTNGFVLETVTGVDKERPKSRERSKTPDIVSSATKWSRGGSSLNDHDLSKKVNFSSQPHAKPAIHQLKTKPKPITASKEMENKPTVRTPELATDGTLANGKSRKSETPDKQKQRSQSETPHPSLKHLQRVNSRNRSLSVPPDPGESFSISTIVKARSLAMRWRGKNLRMGRRHTVLPTITDDSTKFSLCANVKCSPQFEAVIKLLEVDEEVDDASRNFKLLNIK